MAAFAASSFWVFLLTWHGTSVLVIGELEDGSSVFELVVLRRWFLMKMFMFVVFDSIFVLFEFILEAIVWVNNISFAPDIA